METNKAQAAATRLAAKLDALDLDDDERTVLVGMLSAGATSVEPADGEVEGFEFNPFLGVSKQGGFGVTRQGDNPTENLTLHFSRIEWTYTVQGN